MAREETGGSSSIEKGLTTFRGGGYGPNHYGDGGVWGLYAEYSKDPVFQGLQTQFSAMFGSSFPTFSWEAYQNDANYRQRIINQIKGDPGKQAALDAITGYFQSKAEGTGYNPIDIESIFAPLKDELSQLTAQQQLLGRSDIARGRERSLDMLRENLAGTGLGRSGVAAEAGGDIIRGAAERSDRFDQELRAREAQQAFAIDSHVADMEYSQQLLKQGLDIDQVQKAVDYRRSVQTMNLQGMWQMALQDNSKEPWWMSVADGVSQVVGMWAGGGFQLPGGGGGSGSDRYDFSNENYPNISGGG